MNQRKTLYDDFNRNKQRPNIPTMTNYSLKKKNTLNNVLTYMAYLKDKRRVVIYGITFNNLFG